MSGGYFHSRILASTFLCGTLLGGTAGGACKLSEIAELPVTMADMKPLVSAKINGVDAAFAVDSGAFYSMMSAADAAQFGLKTYFTPFRIDVMGVGGSAQVSMTRVKVFSLAGVPIKDIEFLVGGSEVGANAAGILGQNVLRLADVEYDLGKGVIKLMREDDCRKSNLAYWASDGATPRPFSVMDIQPTTPRSPHTLGTALINGVKIRVVFDTGANTSILSVRAAARAGVKVDAPGVTYAGYSGGIGRGMVRTWIAPVSSFKLGDEEIRNTRLRVGETLVDLADMLIGADFFLSHRIYVATARNKLFFTYNGGPVFNLSAAPAATRPDGADEAQGAKDDGPKTAADFARRGAASAARHEFGHAIADLTRACELAPDEADYFYERGVAERDGRQRSAALADFDRVIELRPDHVPALVARAEMKVLGGDIGAASDDLAAADRNAAKEADARLRMAYAYERADLLAPAAAQFDWWIAAHREDGRLARALDGRCRVRAWLDQNLKGALDDCNAALRMAGNAAEVGTRILNSRGLVRLRLGDYDMSIADFDAALKANPDDVWSLYGRGIAKVRRGRSIEGRADLAAATASRPSIADDFKRHGIGL